MIPVFRPVVHPAARARALGCLESGWLGYGPLCRELEARFIGHRDGWALATSSCTAALFLAGRLVTAPGRSEVVVPAITYVSTAMAFAAAGLDVVIADVSPDSLMLHQGSVEHLIGERTAAIVAVHLFGQRMTTLPLRELAHSCGAFLIEDCAHRIDLLDRPPTAPDICCYSFNAVKEAPAGEGGLLWSCRSELQERARAHSNVGLDIDTLERSAELRHLDYRWTTEVGMKLRLNDVAAALTLGALDQLPSTRADRAEVFALLDHELSGLAPLGIAPLARKPDDSYLMYVLRVPAAARDSIRRGLADRGIATSFHYPSLSRHPLWSATAVCPIAEAEDGRLITLPCPPGQAPAVRQVARAVLEACDGIETGQ